MRPIDSAYDRMAAKAVIDAAEIIARLNSGEVIPYEDMEDLNDMAIAEIRSTIDLIEEPGDGYRAA